MNPKNIAMLVSLLETIKAAAEASGHEYGEAIKAGENDGISGIADRLKSAAHDATYFKRFPEEIHAPMKEIVHPPTATSEALMIACIWIAKLDERVDMLEKRGSTLEAQLAGQRDRMDSIEQSIEDRRYSVSDVHGRLNAIGERIDALGTNSIMVDSALGTVATRVNDLEIAMGRDEVTAAPKAAPVVNLGTKRSDNT